jgi:hypothetical protein
MHLLWLTVALERAPLLQRRESHNGASSSGRSAHTLFGGAGSSQVRQRHVSGTTGPAPPLAPASGGGQVGGRAGGGAWPGRVSGRAEQGSSRGSRAQLLCAGDVQFPPAPSPMGAAFVLLASAVLTH